MIIDEIKSLPPDEQAGVVRFVYQLDAERKLSGNELSALAERFVSATDPSKLRGSAKRLSAVFTARNAMPRIQRRNLPPILFDHLLDRARSREIPPQQLGELAQWLDSEPEVPAGKWFKRLGRRFRCRYRHVRGSS